MFNKQFPIRIPLLVTTVFATMILSACGGSTQAELPAVTEASAAEAIPVEETMLEGPAAVPTEAAEEDLAEPADVGGNYQLGFAPGDPNLKASDPSTVSLQTGKPQYIDFFAFWCTYCQQMAPVSHGLENKYGDVMNFVYLDIDDPNTQSLRETFSYSSRWRPYIILMDSSGQVYGQPFIGVTDGAVIEQAIIDMLSAEGIPAS